MTNFVSPRFWVLGVLLFAGLGIRLYDLTDPPLDFHSTRQMLSLSKARGMYYQTRTDVPAEQRAFAIRQWKSGASVEPTFFERVVAFTYQFTGEKTWVARIYSSLFWVIGAVFIFMLAREFTSINGAFGATAFFLFLPYAVYASRSFQPDPLMVTLVIIFWWAVFRWAKQPPSYKWAVIAGLFGGFAIFIKLSAAFFVIAGGLGAVLGREPLRELVRRPQAYVMSVLGIIPGAAYIVYGICFAGYLGQQFGGRFIPALFLDPSYYLGWMGMINLVMGGMPLLFGLLGFYFVRERSAFRFLLGLWAGYAFFGLYFNYHISTHDYYSLLLIPIVALSLGPLFDFLSSAVTKTTLYQRAKAIPILLIFMGLFLVIWNTRAVMKFDNYRQEPDRWIEISRLVGRDARLIALSQDYGMRLAYWAWRSTVVWPSSGDIYYHENRGADFEFEKSIEKLTSKKDYFLVTDFEELGRQPRLKEWLQSETCIAFSGDGFIIYDLKSDCVN